MSPRHSLFASFAALATLFAVACGGETNTGGSSNGGATGTEGNGGGGTGVVGSTTGGGAGGGGAVGGGGTTGAAGTCVDIDLSTYDVSCNQTSDCASITAGEICDGDCTCGGAAINASGQARYESAISSVELGACECPFMGSIECIDQVCTRCMGLPSDPPACQTQAVDAGRACVDVDLSTYDTSCQEDTDCTMITAGTLCSDSCMCGGATINTDGLGRYNMEVSALGTTGTCPCPAEGVPRCIANKCTICGFGPDQPLGCSDGG